MPSAYPIKYSESTGKSVPSDAVQCALALRHHDRTPSVVRSTHASARTQTHNLNCKVSNSFCQLVLLSQTYSLLYPVCLLANRTT